MIDTLLHFVDHFMSFVHPKTLFALMDNLQTLFGSFNLYLWLLVVLPIIRFQVPSITVFIIHLIRPSFWQPPASFNNKQHWPMVSVLIAGLNEAETIGATIKSVLNCGYTNLEVIFVDDCSTDETAFVARKFEKTGRVRVFSSISRNGKPSSLNIAISMAKGEYLFIVDADSEVQFGAIHDLIQPMKDPDVGAVAANLKVRNATENVVTRLQECEYAQNVTMARLWRAKLEMLSIIPGAGGLFRKSAVDEVKGFDTGLGDDTDLTIRLRKLGWKLRFSTNAIVWTNVPTKWRQLFSQRQRWERNMVKIRLRKQQDLFSFWRYGWTNTWMMVDLVLTRMVLPMLFVIGLVTYLVNGPLSMPIVLTHLYWITMVFSFIKLAIAYDVTGTPRLVNLWMVPLIPFYRMLMRLVVLFALIRETLRIGMKHSYVPPKIWNQIKHW